MCLKILGNKQCYSKITLDIVLEMQRVYYTSIDEANCMGTINKSAVSLHRKPTHTNFLCIDKIPQRLTQLVDLSYQAWVLSRKMPVVGLIPI